MSLAIDIGKVKAVLLGNDWHVVANNSFVVDSYEYKGNVTRSRAQSGSAIGFQFVNGSGQTISGPLTSVIAVEH